MELVKLDLQSRILHKAWNIYKEAFPKDEQRPQEKQAKVMKLPNYSFFALVDESSPVALFAVWEFENFLFVEHFAVMESMRGKGIGTKMFQGYLENARKLVLVEVDPPKNPKSKKTVSFYEKLGFRLNDYDYIQPAYSEDTKPVKMKLMSFPGVLTPTEFADIRAEIHRNVYELDKPLLD